MKNNKLITYKPQRIFTFGCSFTSYFWPTWPNILAYELDIPLYNYGKLGAGNQYIFNSLMQADNYYEFNTDDLILVCWTNVSREDRRINNRWITPGNIFTAKSDYNDSYIKQYADVVGYTTRDFASIKASWEMLLNKKCQFHFLKMLDFEYINQWELNEKIYNVDELFTTYKKYLDNIHKSFYEVLWSNDLSKKRQSENARINNEYVDGHPTVVEHFTYLEKTFDYSFSNKTKDIVYNTQDLVDTSIKEQLLKNVLPWEMNFTEIFFNKSNIIKMF